MRILRKIAVLTAVFAAESLLFVVVCPFTATPNAVIRTGHSAPAPHVAVTLVATVSVVLFSFGLLAYQRAAEARDPKPPLAVLSSTCVQLC